MKYLEFLFIRRDLLLSMFSRQLKNEYKGSYLGHFWIIVQPLLMITVYAYVLTPLLQGRWGSDVYDGKYSFTIALFTGFIIFEVFGNSFSSAPTLISGHSSYVKKIVFPLQFFPIIDVAVNAYKSFLLLAILIAFAWLAGISPSKKILLFPVLIAPVVIMSLGISLLLSALGVFIKDLTNICGVMRQALFFLTPIIYPYSLLENNKMTILLFNPLAILVEEGRKIVFDYGTINAAGIASTYLFAFVFLIIGLQVFRFLRHSFADVI